MNWKPIQEILDSPEAKPIVDSMRDVWTTETNCSDSVIIDSFARAIALAIRVNDLQTVFEFQAEQLTALNAKADDQA